jgi:hypothetical protein
MAEEMKPLKKGHREFVKEWNAKGKVLFARDNTDSDEDKYYHVQVTHFFRRSNLELNDPEAEREERDRVLDQKASRLEKAKLAAEHALATGKVNIATFQEFMTAYNELQKELES